MTEESAAERLLARIRSELGLPGADELTSPALPPLPSRLATAELASASVAAVAAAAGDVGGASWVPAHPDRIASAYASERRLRLDGERPTAFAPLSGFFPTADGWVRTHGNYPHHAAAMRRALGIGDGGRDAAAAALLRRGSAQASAAITAEGGLCVPVAREDPDADVALRAAPLVTTTPLGPADPQPLSGDAQAPLSGIRVLDLTRVIAGPVGTRTLALLGAEVLRIDPPRIPEIPWQHLDTGHGKRSALLDVSTAGGRDRLERLLARADVVALGYRAAAMDRWGLSPRELAARHPGIVVARHSAWGDPDRRGFDSLVQAASGIAWIESGDGATPGVLPAQALDHSTGYLLAAGVVAMLGRRAREGGSWLVETSLRRVAAELLGMPRSSAPRPPASLSEASADVQAFQVDGHTVQTAAPALICRGRTVDFAPPRAWGQDPPEWIGA